MGLVIVDSKGRISIPSRARRETGIEIGERLLVIVDEKRITLVKADLSHGHSSSANH